MKVIRPSLGHELVESLRNWQLQLYIHKLSVNGLPVDGDRYQGSLASLHWDSTNQVVQGKFKWLVGSRNRRRWQKVRRFNLGNVYLPDEMFAIPMSMGSSITMVTDYSCRIARPNKRLVMVFFSRLNHNYLDLDYLFQTKVNEKAETQVNPRGLNADDWNTILSAVSENTVDEYAIQDLLWLNQMAPDGFVRINDLFADLVSLNGGASKHYAIPMRDRLNGFFKATSLPYVAQVYAKDSAKDWCLSLQFTDGRTG